MPRQSTAPAAHQRRTTSSPFPVIACKGETYAFSSSALRCLLFCLFFMKYWESIFLPSTPDVCRAVDATGLKKLTRLSTPLGGDTCHFLFFTFAKAKSLSLTLFPGNRPAAQSKGLTEAYVFEVAGGSEQGHGETKGGDSHSTGYPHAGEPNPTRGDELGSYRKVMGATHFSKASAGATDTPFFHNEAQLFEEEKARKLRRVLEIFTRRNSGAKNTENTERAAMIGKTNAGTAQVIFGKDMLIEREREDELKAAKMHRIITAYEDRNKNEVADAYKKLYPRGAERMNKKEHPPTQTGATRADAAEQKAGPRLTEGTPNSARVPVLTKQKAAQKLDEAQIQKIRHGIKFTQKFDFDKACDEAQQASSVRLVWNIIYTDEFLKAQKLYEKMEAYVLRQYIALLKQERELQKIPIVGNPQLMRLLRSLLKREHIQTTKTDAQIGKLFQKVPRLFDWIPSVDREEQRSNTTTRNRHFVDEL